MAPGTPLRDGLERILRGRTGALIVLGRNRAVDQVSTGGFELSVPFSAQSIRELAKMDGAIVMDTDSLTITAAGVHLMPDARIETPETGTRHRTADRVARQCEVPVITVSASMSTLSLFLNDGRHLVEDSAQILSRADQALQTMERYRDRLTGLVNRLSALEVEDQVTVRDLALVVQRLEMVIRLEREISGYVIELGTDGRLLSLQLHELNAGVDEIRQLIELDYGRDPDGGDSFRAIDDLSTTELLDPLSVSRAIGYSNDHLDARITARGLRQLAQINKLPSTLGPRLIEHFGSLQALFGASAAELQDVDGVGDGRARIIRDGLTRLAESAYTERLS
ncbi:MAG: DNA integrity scanning diadenylate cyclase DisA [Propionibacteriales bacterium]|nr:DNA integrity scanning diadenylate cyclase DisA [Propionibacteriales bacterium]